MKCRITPDARQPDGGNDLYFIKDNNLLPICLFAMQGFYLYIHTEEILDAALSALGLPDEPKAAIPIRQGDFIRQSLYILNKIIQTP